MAVSGITIGAVMIEVRVAGLSGAIAATAGGRLLPAGKNLSSAHNAPANEPTSTTTPAAMRTTPSAPTMTLRLARRPCGTPRELPRGAC